MSQPPPAPPRPSTNLFINARRPSGTAAPSRLPLTAASTSAAAGGNYSRLPPLSTAVAAGVGAGRMSPQQTSAARFGQAMDVDSPTGSAQGGRGPSPLTSTSGAAAPQMGMNAMLPGGPPRPINRLPGASASASPNPPSLPPTTNGIAPPPPRSARLPSTTINRSHPGLQPPSHPPSTPTLDLTLRRLLLLLPTLLETYSAPPLPMLDGLFPGDVREGFEVRWKEEEKKKREERRARTKGALETSEKEIRSYLKNLVEEVGGAGLAGGERLEKLEKGLKELLARPTVGAEAEEKMERMEKKIQALEASLTRQRTTYEAQLHTYEARFSALEARLAVAPPQSQPEGGNYITQEDLQGYADKVDHAMGRLDSKGKEVARRLGVEWRSAPKEGEEEVEGGVLGAVERIEAKGEVLERNVDAVEKKLGELEVELRGVESKVESKREEGGDVEMKDRNSEAEEELLPRLVALESTLNALQTSLATTASTSPSSSELESQLSALQLSTTELQSSLEGKIDALKSSVGSKMKALQQFSQYFQVDNRLSSFDQLTSHWPAIKLILDAWKAQNPPPPPSVAAPAVNGDTVGEGEEVVVNGAEASEGAEAHGVNGDGGWADEMEVGAEEREEQEEETPVQANGAAEGESPKE